MFKDNPETRLNFPDFSRLCGQKWQTMNEQDREQFEAQAIQVNTNFDNHLTTVLSCRTRNATRARWQTMCQWMDFKRQSVKSAKRIPMRPNGLKLRSLSSQQRLTHFCIFDESLNFSPVPRRSEKRTGRRQSGRRCRQGAWEAMENNDWRKHYN